MARGPAHPADSAETPSRIGFSLGLALLVALLLAGYALLPRMFAGPRGGMVGEEAPDFTLKVLANGEGDRKRLTLSDLRGHPVILDFWATWCGPCQAEAPLVDKIAQRFKDRGLAVVGVNTSDEEGAARRWAISHELSFPIVHDEGNQVAAHFGVQNLPTLIVISRSGKVLAVRQGITGDSELERLVKEAL